MSGRRGPASAGALRVEVLGVAGSGKTTLARALRSDHDTVQADFIHTRIPRHLAELFRSVPRLLPILADGLVRRPRISWREVKLLAYATRWRSFVGAPPGTAVVVFDQGPLYAIVRLAAEGKPFTRRPSFARWRTATLRDCRTQIDVVVWLDAPDEVLWRRINERNQAHATKGGDAASGYRFLGRYRVAFELLAGELDVAGGPTIVRLDTGARSPDRIADGVRVLLAERRSEHATPDLRTVADG
jgi:adenylate kinase family enzyme